MPDPTGLAREGAQRFVDAAVGAVGEGRPFRVALSGGSTPKALFETLAQEPYRSQ
ncbi:MAG: 6-phosphogluconolactonase, partial [Chloroflexota bacterium]|nr:6-phosphogluconolactonase [Chloroflexota bacterium]